MAPSEAQLRCVECRCEYELPQRGAEIACPECGCRSWVSTRISDATTDAAPATA